jgi:hypothetical protein
MGEIKGDNFIYNLKRPLAFKSGKSQNPFLSLRDNYLITKQTSEIFKFLHLGIENAERFLGDDLKMSTLYTRKYYVS